MPFAVRNATRSPQLSGVQPLPPTIASGRSDAASSSRMRARSAAAGAAATRGSGHGVGRVRHRRAARPRATRARRARAGPATAVAKARATSSGIRSRLIDLEDPLGDAPEHLLVVDLLERLAPAVLARHLADQQHERRGVLHRRVHAGRGVRRARAARHHAHAGAAGQLAVGVRGVRGRGLVAARDHAQPVAVRVEPVQERQIALARHAERKLHVVQRRAGRQAAARRSWERDSQLDGLVQEHRVALRLRALAVLVAHVADGRRTLERARKHHAAHERARLVRVRRRVDRIGPGLEPRLAGRVVVLACRSSRCGSSRTGARGCPGPDACAGTPRRRAGSRRGRSAGGTRRAEGRARAPSARPGAGSSTSSKLR